MDKLLDVKMTVFIACDRKTFPILSMEKILKKWGIYSEDADIVINVDPVLGKFTYGREKTIFWEADDFLNIGKRHYADVYDHLRVDLHYINHKEYLNSYPVGTRVLPMACDPNVDCKRKTDRHFKYVFVGAIEPTPVYYSRLTILDELLKKGEDLYITNTKDHKSYVKAMSEGDVIINILPVNLDNGLPCINTRVYEAMAVGCLMMNYNPILDDYFIPNVHYIPLERFGKVSDEEIKQVAKNSREFALKNTWKHRLETMLKDL